MFIELSEDIYGRSFEDNDYCVSPATGIWIIHFILFFYCDIMLSIYLHLGRPPECLRT